MAFFLFAHLFKNDLVTVSDTEAACVDVLLRMQAREDRHGAHPHVASQRVR